eukprot:m.364072 g.364072  ORF g.364072 m.364072 type:complete len:284 (+) comp28075_c1_seq4:271-1122(+)
MSTFGVGTAPGKHCAQPDCNALDFLPYICYGCRATFCADHHKYDKHACSSPGAVSREVPRCPLCQTEVALKPGQSLDQAVNDHISAGCKKNSGKGKTYGNACGKKGCKKREAIPLVCKGCGRNFCLGHRFETDHECSGSAAKIADRGRAAEQRRAHQAPAPSARKAPAQQLPAQRSPAATRFGTAPARGLTHGAADRRAAPRAVGGSAAAGYQNGMSDEDAMAMALAASAQDARQPKASPATAAHAPSTGEDADLELALAMSASLADDKKKKKKEPTKDCSMM